MPTFDIRKVTEHADSRKFTYINKILYLWFRAKLLGNVARSTLFYFMRVYQLYRRGGDDNEFCTRKKYPLSKLGLPMGIKEGLRGITIELAFSWTSQHIQAKV